MSVVQIVVPVSKRDTHLLESCLRSIKESTSVDHTVYVVIRDVVQEESIGEIYSIAMSVYNRSGLVVHESKDGGYNKSVIDGLGGADLPYAIVVPATHILADKEWFGKMQLPLIRVPHCGMVIAFDQDPQFNTRPAFPWSWKEKVTTKVFMISRMVLQHVLLTPNDWDGDDIANSVRDHLRTMGIVCWGVPSVRTYAREMVR